MKIYKKRHIDSVIATQWFKPGDHWGVKVNPTVPYWGITEDGVNVLSGDYVVELGHGEIEIYTSGTFERLYEPALPEKLRIYYSIQNGGDGSAYPEFMDTRGLAEWDQDHMVEGWAETCWGELDIVSDSPITIEKVQSTIGYYLEKEVDDWWESGNKTAFEAEFFPLGVPKFEAKILEGCDQYYYVFVDGVQHYKERGWNRETGFEISVGGLEEFQKTLDKLSHNEPS